MGEGDRGGIEPREYWRGQVDRWRESGLTQKEYSVKEGISVERLGTWKRRFERETPRGAASLVAVPVGTVSSALQRDRPALGVVVNGGYRVEIDEGFCPAALERVLQVLRRL